jgi:hypothetical protein
MRSRIIRWVGWFLLFEGLFASVLIYRNADPDYDPTIIGYEIEGVNSYPIHAGGTKRAQAASEAVGGKAFGAVNDFSSWFATLWHGRRLAYTVAVLSGLAWVICYYLADFLRYPYVMTIEEKDKK